MRSPPANSQFWLTGLLVLNVFSTTIHYYDNYVHFDRYLMPAWITQNGVWIAWLVLTVIGAIGYWLYRQRQFGLAYGSLALYALTGASTPGHYFYAPLNHFTSSMNVMIWSDGIVGFALIVFLLWSALIVRPWQISPLN